MSIDSRLTAVEEVVHAEKVHSPGRIFVVWPGDPTPEHDPDRDVIIRVTYEEVDNEGTGA